LTRKLPDVIFGSSIDHVISHLILERPLANIISFKNKKNLAQEKQAGLTKKRKVQAVRKVFQCTHCALKCEKCGSQISGDAGGTDTYQRKLNVPYNFCDECSDEYIDYIERLQGGGDPDCYWHNDAWIDAGIGLAIEHLPNACGNRQNQQHAADHSNREWFHGEKLLAISGQHSATRCPLIVLLDSDTPLFEEILRN
jgi:hypothetical protein